MKNKIDPRTGTVVPKKNKVIEQIVAPKIHSNNKNVIMQNKSSASDMHEILKALQEMTQAIIQELKQPRAIIQEVKQPASQSSSHTHKGTEISIDESISDVGIGQAEKLKKHGNQAIGRKENLKDFSLASSKNKLKALKEKK